MTFDFILSVTYFFDNETTVGTANNMTTTAPVTTMEATTMDAETMDKMVIGKSPKDSFNS